MNLMLLKYNELTKDEQDLLKRVVCYWMPSSPTTEYEELSIAYLLVQKLDQVIEALKCRMKSKPEVSSERTLLIQLEALKF